MDQVKSYEELVAENKMLKDANTARVKQALIDAQPKIETYNESERVRQDYERYDEKEITMLLLKKNPQDYQYSSTDFLNLGKYRLSALLEQAGTTVFYHWNKGKKHKNMFVAPLLQTYIQIIYPIKTIRPLVYSPKDQGDMYFWNWGLGQYVPVAEVEFNQHVKTIFRDRFKQTLLNQTYPNIRYETYIDREDFALEPEFIPVANQLLWLHKIGEEWVIEEAPTTPALYITSRIPVEYDPEATCPTWIKTLNTCLPDQQKEITWLQEYVGYSLYRTWDYDRVVMFLGDGDNGKTTILETIRKLLGHHNCKSIGLWNLCNRNWFTADLYLALANIDPDTGSKDLENTSKFKAATGGDTIMGERKFGHPFYFAPYCKHYLGANKMPYCYDDTDGFYRRWFIFRFLEQFPVGDPRRDAQLPHKLKAELPGILNWALEGLIRLLQNDGFTNPPTTAENKSLWNRLSNPIYAFIYSDDIIIDSNGEYPQQDFYEDYIRYCKQFKLPVWTKDRVGKRINHHFDFVHRV